jgi:hypothetical protein
LPDERRRRRPHTLALFSLASIPPGSRTDGDRPLHAVASKSGWAAEAKASGTLRASSAGDRGIKIADFDRT